MDRSAHTKFSKINEIHKKGDRGGGTEALLFFISGCGEVTAGCPAGAASAEQVRERSERDLRPGAEPDAVEISYLPRPLYVSR